MAIPRESTFDSVCEMYVSQKYDVPIIVFDGCTDDTNTKDVTQMHRTGGKIGVVVHFTGGMVINQVNHWQHWAIKINLYIGPHLPVQLFLLIIY
jgi:hypothetical protein